MRSSTGEHYPALDHIRALAAFLVFVWHFAHGHTGTPVQFEYYPRLVPFALLDEGHTGVALFMVLSGYLFAKLLDGRQVDIRAFLVNRCLRLLPLLVVVILLEGILVWQSGGDPRAYARNVAWGVARPTLPSGGWSITVEFHFYLLLPLLLWLARRSPARLAGVIAVALAVRTALFAWLGEVHSLAYATIIGRIDQFTWGMIAYHYRRLARPAIVAIVLAAFSLIYWAFDREGGLLRMPAFPSPSAIWIVLPSIEGVAYAAAVAWYDSSARPISGWLSAVLTRLGMYSYSIYLLHRYVMDGVPDFIDRHILALDNFYVVTFVAALAFVCMLPVGYLSFRFVEAPFLSYRRSYLIGRRSPSLGAAGGASTEVAALLDS